MANLQVTNATSLEINAYTRLDRAMTRTQEIFQEVDRISFT
jgi:hypothetical protein